MGLLVVTLTILGIFELAIYLGVAALTKGFCDTLFKNKDIVDNDNLILNDSLGIIWPIFWCIFFVVAIIFWLCKGIKKISTIARISWLHKKIKIVLAQTVACGNDIAKIMLNN